MMKKFFCLPVLLAALLALTHEDASAQKKKKKKEKAKELRIYDVDTLIKPIPRQRIFFSDKIDNEQKRADYYDGSRDNTIFYAEDTLSTRLLTQALLRDMDQIQVMIENLPFTDQQTENQTKIRYYNAANNLMKRFNADTRIDPVRYRKEVTNLKDMIIARHEGKLMEFAHENVSVQSLNNSELLENDPAAKAYVYAEMGKKDPRMMIRRLGEYATEPFACDIIKEAAKVVPGEVFNYAYSTNYTYSNAVKKCQDPLVQTIVKIATQSKSPLKAMSFLSDVHNGRKTIAEIDAITADQNLFFKNLVRLKLENESLGGNTYTDELKYRGMKYVRDMNDLHEATDAVRFKCIDGFAPEELYFIMVYGQDEIYTSSFIGTFKRMMERMSPMTGDQLLDRVHYDRFRTFIRMCAGYNTLAPFLATVEEGKKNDLMRDFVANLEKGGEDDLEDAVDVADAFGSIEDPKLASFLREEVNKNYERTKTADSKKGIIVYGLLSTIFKSFVEGSVDGDPLGLPPVNLVPYRSMVGDTNIVFEQIFFYGDEDGKMSYASFMANFKDGNWKVTNENKYWTKIESVTGRPTVIYANQPLPEPEDEEAQNKLASYLSENNIHPTFIIHRGHSYHLPLTLDKLQKQNRIVMLGSCGGYHNLGTVLDKAPDAQIISTKQTGTAFNNDKILKKIHDRLLAGQDIDWVTIWKELSDEFAVKGGDYQVKFKDYVPPHKNLGAIFIKAYRRLSMAGEKL